jgi:hypothetical protein
MSRRVPIMIDDGSRRLPLSCTKGGRTMSHRLVSLGCLLLVALVGGCRKGVESGPASEGPAPSAPTPREVAAQAQTELFDQLSSRLIDALSQGGPAAAIPVCKEEAPRIAQAVGQKHHVSIGRTSFRLRNPRNAPPTWATSLVAERTAEPQFLDLPDGRLGALLPIRLKPQCTLCHGPEAELAPEVKTALKDQYPDDQATGFREGDLRGWFWIEVPARAEGDL